MKIFKFVLLLIIVSCSKEDKLEYDKSISYKNGVTMAPIFFEKNGTTTNVKVSNGTDLFYESFNYEFIDSIVFKQVSSSYAKVGYSNSESMAMANYDILMYYKSNVVYKIENYLSEYKDDPICFKI